MREFWSDFLIWCGADDDLFYTFYALIPFVSPWYDLRGWLGVKQQLSTHHCCDTTHLSRWSLVRISPPPPPKTNKHWQSTTIYPILPSLWILWWTGGNLINFCWTERERVLQARQPGIDHFFCCLQSSGKGSGLSLCLPLLVAAWHNRSARSARRNTNNAKGGVQQWSSLWVNGKKDATTAALSTWASQWELGDRVFWSGTVTFVNCCLQIIVGMSSGSWWWLLVVQVRSSHPKHSERETQATSGIRVVATYFIDTQQQRRDVTTPKHRGWPCNVQIRRTARKASWAKLLIGCLSTTLRAAFCVSCKPFWHT